MSQWMMHGCGLSHGLERTEINLVGSRAHTPDRLKELDALRANILRPYTEARETILASAAWQTVMERDEHVLQLRDDLAEAESKLTAARAAYAEAYGVGTETAEMTQAITAAEGEVARLIDQLSRAESAALEARKEPEAAYADAIDRLFRRQLTNVDADLGRARQTALAAVAEQLDALVSAELLARWSRNRQELAVPPLETKPVVQPKAERWQDGKRTNEVPQPVKLNLAKEQPRQIGWPEETRFSHLREQDFAVAR